MTTDNFIINFDDPILITGSNGFIGTRVVKTLLDYGFSNLRCFIRSSRNLKTLSRAINSSNKVKIEFVSGNLLSLEDCKKATEGVALILHLAAGIEKSFSGAFMNSVVTTKNLLETIIGSKDLKRFLNVSSFSVYSNAKIKRGKLLDESCEVESKPQERGEAYCFGKIKQDETVLEYSKKYNIPFVIVRPGYVIGPGKKSIPPYVGIDTFGFFLHLGGRNKIPLSYIDNCAEAIVLASIKKGVNGQIFNIVDDNLPSSRKFLKMYKKNVGHFNSIYIPYSAFYIFCYFWEQYSKWSNGQLPPAFNRKRCSAVWKGNEYSNQKLKNLLGWKPKVSIDKALDNYFEYQRKVLL